MKTETRDYGKCERAECVCESDRLACAVMRALAALEDGEPQRASALLTAALEVLNV